MMSDIVNVFIGVILTFATMSLAASSVTEAIASALKWRAKTLVTGLQQLLNDPNLTGLANAILNHGAINPRTPGTSTGVATAKGIVPSYIPPLQFATAFMDVLQTTQPLVPAAGNLPPLAAPVGVQPGQQIQAALPRQDLSASIDQITDPQLRTLLQGIYARANGDVEKIQGDLANWFDASMDRVSGVYKRKSQLVSFLVALVLAVVLNVSVFRVAETIWAHPQVSESLTQNTSADESALMAIKNFKQADFPFGWNTSFDAEYKSLTNTPTQFFLGWLLAVLGWMATAVATLFGAPFWFDTLQRFVRLGGTGPKPDATKDPES